jgi:hypothetical protein
MFELFGRRSTAPVAAPPPLPPPPRERVKLDYFVYNEHLFFENVAAAKTPDPTLRPDKKASGFDIFRKLSFA